MEQVRAEIRARHYSRRTEDAYVHWIRRFIVFLGRRHPLAASMLTRGGIRNDPPNSHVTPAPRVGSRRATIRAFNEMEVVAYQYFQ
jgi:hypothetical protein